MATEGTLEDRGGGVPQGTMFAPLSIMRTVLFAVVPLIIITMNLFIAVVLADDDLDFTDVDTFLYKLIISLDIVSLIVYPVIGPFFGFNVLGSLDTIQMVQVCLISCFTYAFLLLLTTWMLSAIAINKYIYITFPLKYPIYVTIRRVKVFTILAFLLSVLCALMFLPFRHFPFLDTHECSPDGFQATLPTTLPYLLMLPMSLSLPLGLIIFFNLAMIQKAVSQSKRFRRVAVQQHADDENPARDNLRDDVQGVREGIRHRGLKNVIRLVSVALFSFMTNVLTMITLCFIVDDSGVDAVAFLLNDVSQYVWNSKMVVLMLSDVKLKRATRQRIKKIARRLKFKGQEY
nr:G-protein coupled receptor 161-like [Lytechinus pictus]